MTLHSATRLRQIAFWVLCALFFQGVSPLALALGAQTPLQLAFICSANDAGAHSDPATAPGYGSGHLNHPCALCGGVGMAPPTVQAHWPASVAATPHAWVVPADSTGTAIYRGYQFSAQGPPATAA